MNMTSLTLGDDESIINAEGDMGVYGRVYVTFRLTVTRIVPVAPSTALVVALLTRLPW